MNTDTVIRYKLRYLVSTNMEGGLLYDRPLNDKNILNASHEGKRAYTKDMNS